MNSKVLAPEEVYEDVEVADEDTFVSASDATVEDIDPDAWLSSNDGVLTDHVQLKTGDKIIRLKIAAITDAEDSLLLKQSRKMDPKNPKGPGKIDFQRYRRLQIALSLNKANGSNVNPEALTSRLTGHLVTMQKQIMKLSGMDMDDTGAAPDINDFFG